MCWKVLSYPDTRPAPPKQRRNIFACYCLLQHHPSDLAFAQYLLQIMWLCLHFNHLLSYIYVCTCDYIVDILYYIRYILLCWIVYASTWSTRFIWCESFYYSDIEPKLTTDIHLARGECILWCLVDLLLSRHGTCQKIFVQHPSECLDKYEKIYNYIRNSILYLPIRLQYKNVYI